MGVHDTRLLAALKDDNTAAVEHEIRELPDVNFQSQSRHTALHSAVLHNNIQAVRLLLARGADMMVMPTKKTFENQYECPLLMALKMGRSREAIQWLMLRVLRDAPLRHLDAAARQTMARICQQAMMHSTPRVFAAASECAQMAKIVADAAGLTPLMFTLRHVSLYEDRPEKCQKILNNVLTIVDRCPAMAWERLNKGPTALGMVISETLASRKKRHDKYIANFVGINQAVHHLYPGVFAAEVEKNRIRNQTIVRNAAIIDFFSTQFVPSLFGKMLLPMRIALGMATHIRLGSNAKCIVGQLDPDLMNIIFAQLHPDSTHMLC